jgi:hypothetical protein
MECRIAQQRPAVEADVLPENWHAVNVFLDMATQWRTHLGMRGLYYQGLDYGVLPVVLAGHKATPGRQPYPLVLQQLRVLETAALDHLNTRR